MLLALIPLLPLAVVAGGAAFVKESAQALKNLKEGEFSMVSVGEDGTTEMRLLVSERNDAFHMTIVKAGKTVGDFATVDGKTLLVDHEARSIQEVDLKEVEKNADERIKAEKEGKIEPGNVSLNLDVEEGLVLRANPDLENVRRWSADGQEMFTGDFGRGKGKRGTFQWVREAATKLPREFHSTMDGHTVDVRFILKARRVSTTELRIPADAYKGCGTGSALPSGNL